LSRSQEKKDVFVQSNGVEASIVRGSSSGTLPWTEVVMVTPFEWFRSTKYHGCKPLESSLGQRISNVGSLCRSHSRKKDVFVQGPRQWS